MIVADASVVIAALVDAGAAGTRARERLVAEVVAVPELLYPEVVSVVRRLERRNALSEQRAADALGDLLAIPLEVASHRALLWRCWELRHNVTAYDALYVALAELCGALLVTADARLATATGPTCAIDLIGE